MINFTVGVFFKKKKTFIYMQYVATTTKERCLHKRAYKTVSVEINLELMIKQL